MVFNSMHFLVFYAVVTAIYFALAHRFRWVLLLIASYYFYMCWNPTYIVLIVATTTLDWFVGLRIGTTDNLRRKRQYVAASAVLNFGLLFFFKYFNFLSKSVAMAAGYVGTTFNPPLLDVLLPVGISFYTFQSFSYVIDVYRGDLKPEPRLLMFALYVSFFPQLVAGPIERATNLLPQFYQEHRFDSDRALRGLELMAWGLFKKVVIADRLALFVNSVYNNVPEHTGLSYVIATYLFAFQIYCDFSGYTDIAIGAAQVLGFNIMENFRRPYFATTIVDFWRRWHISLSTWLRDYLYIPLGGNRLGPSRTYLNLLITMVLGGIWHGANWTFVIWGTLHGVLLALSKATLPVRDRLVARLGLPRPLVTAVRTVVTFHLVCLTWVFFRANTLSDAWYILTHLATGWPRYFFDPMTLAYGVPAVLLLLIVQFIQERGPIRPRLARMPAAVRWSIYYTVVFAIILGGVDGGSQFIYFQF